MLPGKAIELSPPAALRFDLARVPVELRRPVWEWIQANRPGMAEFLGGDLCAAIKQQFAEFGCSPVLDLDEAEARSFTKQFPNIRSAAI